MEERKHIIMKIFKLIILFIFFWGNISSQTTSKYRIAAHSNPVYFGTDSFPTTVVSFSNTIEIQEPYTLYIPTVFSPDGDNTNDIFYIRGRGFDELSFEIYNRWGQMVFQSDDLNKGWDGTYNNQPSPIGGYVYQLKIEGLITKAGTVTLIR